MNATDEKLIIEFIYDYRCNYDAVGLKVTTESGKVILDMTPNPFKNIDYTPEECIVELVRKLGYCAYVQNVEKY